ARKEDGPSPTTEEEANPDAATAGRNDAKASARAGGRGRAAYRQPHRTRLGQLLPLGQRGARSQLRLLASRHKSPSFRQPTAPEATRREPLDHLEHQGHLRDVGIVPRLQGGLGAASRGKQRHITPPTDSTGNGGWRKSPCPV